MEFTLEELYTKKEGQTYDRKSARKDPKGLSNHIVAFANADGGTLVIGIEDDFTVTGIDNYHNNVNDILRVPFDYCTPSVRVTTETVECTDKNGNPNHLLVMTIPQSSELHANQQDEDNAFMLNATIRNGVISEADEVINEVINGAINISVTEQAILAALKKKARITKVELQKETSLGKSTIDRAIKALKEKGLIERVVSNKTDYWKIIKKNWPGGQFQRMLRILSWRLTTLWRNFLQVKEVAQRARINRKTFYLHYNTLDDLLREIQNEMAQNFIKRTQGLERPRDMDKITREFFLCSEELGKIGERITCSGNYKYISRKITNDIMNQTWKNGAASSAEPPYIQNIIMTYAAQSTLEIYKQWVADGKKIPLEDIIKIATRLICNGINGLNS